MSPPAPSAAGAVLVPLMLLALPLPPSGGKGGAQAGDSGGDHLAFSLVAYLIPTPLSPAGRFADFTGDVVLTGQIAWNKAYRKYVATHAYHREVFRRPMHNLYAHLRGRIIPAAGTPRPAGKWGLTRCPGHRSAAIAAWFAQRRRPIDRAWDWRSLNFDGAQTATVPRGVRALADALFSSHQRLPEFPRTCTLKGVRHLSYTSSRMPSLHWYGSTIRRGIDPDHHRKDPAHPGMTKSIARLCTVLTVLPLLGLRASLASTTLPPPRLAVRSATTGVLIYCTINTTSLLPSRGRCACGCRAG
jgi:hypothetical protein